MARRLALLIGNTTFDHPQTFRELRTPANDVNDLAAVLQAHGDFEILNTLVNAPAAAITAAIDDLLAEFGRI